MSDTAPDLPTPPLNNPHVLVVDDDPQVRSLLQTALARSGFRVSVASSGEEAVAVFRQDGTIQVVLLDVQMPGLSGPETLHVLRQHNPSVNALFMSGGTGMYKADDLAAMTARQLLTKPFPSLTDLMEALRQAAQR